MKETYTIVHHKADGYAEGVDLTLTVRTGKEKSGDTFPVFTLQMSWQEARAIKKALHFFDPEAKAEDSKETPPHLQNKMPSREPV